MARYAGEWRRSVTGKVHRVRYFHGPNRAIITTYCGHGGQPVLLEDIIAPILKLGVKPPDEYCRTCMSSSVRH